VDVVIDEMCFVVLELDFEAADWKLVVYSDWSPVVTAVLAACENFVNLDYLPAVVRYLAGLGVAVVVVLAVVAELTAVVVVAAAVEVVAAVVVAVVVMLN
jgi:hypothetical protein